MRFEIITGYNKAFQWIEADNIRFIGYLNTLKGLFPNENILRKIFFGCSQIQDFKEKIQQLNGVFSIIIRFEECLIIASDSTRFFPVFYTVHENTMYISDDIEIVRLKSNTGKMNTEGKLEFLTAAFTGSKNTLFYKVFQVRPMEMLIAQNNEIKSEYYGRFSKTESEIISILHENLLNRTRLLIDNVFKRILVNLKDIPIALPLSSGFDSRLIACKLKEHGIKNVICFTYGRKSKEVDISEKVAKKLGFPWFFVEYTPDLLKGFHLTPVFNEYYKYASRGTSMFYLQEYPAVKYLVENRIIGSEFYAIPGHSGDLLRGAMLVKSFPENAERKRLANILINKKFIHAPATLSERNILRYRLKNHLKELDFDASLIPYSILEDWELKERTAKYIFNSSHVFTFFGIKTIFPLWDKELFDFFRILPAAERKFGKLYSEVIVKEYFIPNKVWFHNELHPSSQAIRMDSIKKKLRHLLPQYYKEKLLLKNDWACYEPMTQYLLNELHDAGISPLSNGSSYLYRILNWYLMKTELD